MEITNKLSTQKFHKIFFFSTKKNMFIFLNLFNIMKNYQGNKFYTAAMIKILKLLQKPAENVGCFL